MFRLCANCWPRVGYVLVMYWLCVGHVVIYWLCSCYVLFVDWSVIGYLLFIGGVLIILWLCIGCLVVMCSLCFMY